MSDPSDFFAQAKEDIASGDKDYAPTWKPEAGDFLEGIVRGGNWTLTRNSDVPVPVLTVEDTATNEEWTVWCSNTMLKSFIVDNAPAIGAPIVIHYEGKVWNQDKTRQYHKFDARVAESDFEHWHGKHKEAFLKAEMTSGTTNPPTQEVVKTNFGPDEAPF